MQNLKTNFKLTVFFFASTLFGQSIIRSASPNCVGAENTSTFTRSDRLIKSTASSAIVDTSGIGKVVMEDIGVIESTVAPAIKLRRLNFLKNCDVKCSWGNASGHAIEFIDDLDIGVNRPMNVRLMVKNAELIQLKIQKPSASLNIELDNVLN